MNYRFIYKVILMIVIVGAGGNLFSAIFDPLFRITSMTGDVFVHKPDGSVVKGQEFFAYPYGSKIALPPVPEKPLPGYEKPSAEIKLSPTHSFKISPDTELIVGGAASDTGDFKTIEIKRGTISSLVRLPYDQKDAMINALKVKTYMAECIGIDGKSDIKVNTSKDKYSVIFAFTDNATKISGDQFELKGERNTVVEIFGDDSFVRISCLRGSINASVKRGLSGFEKATLKTGGQIKLWRAFNSSGALEAVSVMLVYSSGKTVSYSYVEGEEATTLIIPNEPEKGGDDKRETSGQAQNFGGDTDGFGGFDEPDNSSSSEDSSGSDDWGDIFNNNDFFSI